MQLIKRGTAPGHLVRVLLTTSFALKCFIQQTATLILGRAQLVGVAWGAADHYNLDEIFSCQPQCSF